MTAMAKQKCENIFSFFRGYLWMGQKWFEILKCKGEKAWADGKSCIVHINWYSPQCSLKAKSRWKWQGKWRFCKEVKLSLWCYIFAAICRKNSCHRHHQPGAAVARRKKGKIEKPMAGYHRQERTFESMLQKLALSFLFVLSSFHFGCHHMNLTDSMPYHQINSQSGYACCCDAILEQKNPHCKTKITLYATEFKGYGQVSKS